MPLRVRCPLGVAGGGPRGCRALRMCAFRCDAPSHGRPSPEVDPLGCLVRLGCLCATAARASCAARPRRYRCRRVSAPPPCVYLRDRFHRSRFVAARALRLCAGCRAPLGPCAWSRGHGPRRRLPASLLARAPGCLPLGGSCAFDPLSGLLPQGVYVWVGWGRSGGLPACVRQRGPTARTSTRSAR